MSAPADELHELKALVYRLSGDHAAMAARLTTVEDRVEDHAAVLDEIADAAAAFRAADDTRPAEPTDAAEPGLDLDRLVEWVRVNVAELLQRRIPQTGGYPYWCRRWWLHPEAIARFEAARRSWETAVEAGPGDAMVVYFEHLDHQLGVLCAENGPFSGCVGGVHVEDGPAAAVGQDEPPPSYFGWGRTMLDEPVPASAAARPRAAR